MARRPEGWTLYRRKRDSILICRFTSQGQRHSISTRTRDLAEAKIEAARLYEEALSHRRRSRGAPRGELDVLLAEWVASVEAEVAEETAASYESYAFTHWLGFFRKCSSLTDHMVEAYKRHRLRQVTATSVRKELSALRRLSRWIAETGRGEPFGVPSLPRGATGTRAQQRTRVDLRPEEVEAILLELPERTRVGNPVRAFFQVMWETGLRKKTLRSLEVPTHYTPGLAELRITETIDKARFARTIPITPRAVEVLDAVAPQEGRIFLSVDYRHSLERAALRAGLSPYRAARLSYHDLRHARTTHLLEAGGSLPGVAYLMGHRHVTTTNRYTHAQRKAAEEALKGILAPNVAPSGESSERAKKDKGCK